MRRLGVISRGRRAQLSGHPDLRSWLLRIDRDPDGGMEVDADFFVGLHDRPDGPRRAHEVRLQNGECTTETFQ